MSSSGPAVVGATIAVVVGLAPKVWDKLTGRRGERASEATHLSTSAGVLTDAAMKLVEQYQEDAAGFRAGEARCREEVADLREQVAELRSFHGLDP